MRRFFHVGSASFPGGATGPYVYVERGFMLHAGVRHFRDPWQNGIGAWFTLRVRDRYVVLWMRGA